MASNSFHKSTVPTPSSSDVPQLAAWLFPAYLATIFGGSFLLRTPGVTAAGQEMGLVRSLFTAVNAATLTGFRQTIDIDSYPPLGQAAIFMLMVSGTLFTLIISGAAVSRILRLGYSDARILTAAMIAEVAAIAGGTTILMFDKNRSIAQAVFLSASSFGNAGLFVGRAPSSMAWHTHVALLPLIALGGVGLCVILELYDRLLGRTAAITSHARTALTTTAAMYVGGTLLLAALSWEPGESWTRLLPQSAAAAVASRTAGLGLIALAELTRPAVWVVMLMMIIGGCSGGAAGGVKTTTLAELFHGIRRALAGQSVGRGFGVAATWVAVYAALVCSALLILSHQLPDTPPDRVLFLTISAASNVGLNFEPLSPDPITAFLLCATMLIGRMGPLMVLWWMADTTAEVELAVG